MVNERMIKILLVLTGLIVSIGFSSDKIGAFFIGADFLPNNEYNETSSGVYQLQRTGLSLGILIPLNVPYLDCHIKIKASTHEIEKKGWDWEGTIQKNSAGLFDRHASAVNELLIGREYFVKQQVSVLPQFGVGFQLDALNQDGDSSVNGIVYSCLFTDYSVMWRYHFEKMGVGLLSHFQWGVLPSWDGYEATNRISLSMLIFR